MIERRDYLPRCVCDMIEVGKKYGAGPFTAGAQSKREYPHPPFYLRKDSILDSFDPAAYCGSPGGHTASV